MQGYAIEALERHLCHPFKINISIFHRHSFVNTQLNNIFGSGSAWLLFKYRIKTTLNSKHMTFNYTRIRSNDAY